jgi:aminoglycoside 6'-N-acetyltransferase
MPASTPTPVVRFRAARPADAPLLRRWDDDPYVQASDPNDDWNWVTELTLDPAWRQQWVAEVDARPIGFVQIIDAAEEETHYWGDVPPGTWAVDIWIGEPDARGHGYGTDMMRQAIDWCFSNASAHTVLVDPLASNTRAHTFYERLGFERVGPRQFGDDACVVYALRRL